MDKGSLIAIAFCMMLFTACSEDYESTSVPMEPPLDLSLVSFVEPCKTDSTDTCLYGMVTDDRDGKTYKTVEIGNQVWMAENLNYETPGSFCYNDSPKECETFGRLYWWAAAMDTEGKWSPNGKYCDYGHVCEPVYPLRGVCPAGWHLPTYNEWRTLLGAVGGVEKENAPYIVQNAGNSLRSTHEWAYTRGVDSYGFNVLPAGYRAFQDEYGVIYFNEYLYTYFWTSTQNEMYWAMMLEFSCDNGNAKAGSWYRHFALSVRCVKD